MSTVEYLESQVLTATPHQLHLMVIDGAIRHATSAETALQSRDYARAEAQLGRSNECVAALIAGLDSTRQPQLVDQLKSVFVFVQRTLAEADRRHDPRLIPDALSVLRLHRQTWLALGEKLAQESAPSSAKPRSSFSWTS
ncbi:MAG TPA: flagellar export chaperone FliS [Planctomycetaceae bacterium]|nr:flagellar export chaperone FliS [Planctomycetaceae bacterium]